MNKKPIFQITYVPLLISLECCEEALLPEFLGSTLHGILGWALKPFPKVYRYLFENGSSKIDIVKPYVIDPPKPKTIYSKGDMLRFQLILVGTGADYALEVVHALSSTEIFELGGQRKKFKLISILHGEYLNPIWISGMQVKSASKVILYGDDLLENCTHCSLQMRTPLRIRRSGKLLTELDFPTIIRNITSRISALTTRYGGEYNKEEAERLCILSQQIEQTSAGLHVHKLERYSNRKNEKMDFSGLCGAVTFEGNISPFTPWLYAANTLHIGRNVTLGYGGIEISIY